MAKKQSLTQIETSLSRWKSRLRRAVTMIDKLERQQKRLVKAGRMPDLAIAPASAKPARGSSGETPMEKPSPVSAPVPPTPIALAPRAEIDTSIPSFLRRSPDPVAEAIKVEQAETKRLKAKGRIAKMKAKASGETRKMPLTGKAALAAIRG